MNEAVDLSEIELGKLHILRRVSLESVRGLLEHCAVITMARSQMVLQAGQTNQTMYMVLSGRLSVHLDSAESPAVAFLEAGETVGGIPVIDDSPASAFVIADAPSRLLAIDEETFWRLVRASHAFATNLLMLLAQRMRASNSAIVQNARLREQFEREALVDALTGLHNRRWLDENLPRFMQRMGGDGVSLSVLMIDIDYFKKINDTYGHAAGDQVLAHVASVLATHVRPTDFSVRYGGEEFVIILPRTALARAQVAAERVRAAVAGTTCALADGQTLSNLSVSIGVAEHAGKAQDPAPLLAQADEALYRAKTLGRNRVELSASPAGRIG